MIPGALAVAAMTANTTESVPRRLISRPHSERAGSTMLSAR